MKSWAQKSDHVLNQYNQSLSLKVLTNAKDFLFLCLIVSSLLFRHTTESQEVPKG